jgi:hypothetical protein
LVVLDVNIMTDIPKYSLNDLIGAVALAFLSFILTDRDEHSYYKSKEKGSLEQIQAQALTIQVIITLQIIRRRLRQNLEGIQKAHKTV